MREACRRWHAEFAGKRFWPAPEHPRLSSSRRDTRCSHPGKCIEPAYRETRRKADCRHPIPGRGAAKGGGRALDFVKRIRFKASRQQFVERRTAKLPDSPPRRGARIIGLRRWIPARSMPLQAQNARAKPCDYRCFHGCNRLPDHRHGPNRTAYRGTFRSEIRCDDWNCRGHKKPQVQTYSTRQGAKPFLFCSKSSGARRQDGLSTWRAVAVRHRTATRSAKFEKRRRKLSLIKHNRNRGVASLLCR